jgi:aryl-alcohol dehydrogenase-like predicted oxidoreductase
VLRAGLLAGLGTALAGSLLATDTKLAVITKAIPSSGEKIPVMGIGTNHFGFTDHNVVRDILKCMYELDGTVIDTAANYEDGESESRIGKALAELGLTNKMFIATKLNSPGGGLVYRLRSAIGIPPSRPPPYAIGGMESYERSMRSLQKIDLMFVHFLESVEPMMPVVTELKKQRRVRYIGITTVQSLQYPQLLEYMRRYPIDFVQVNYSLGDRSAEAEVLPLAQQRKIAVMAAVPLGGGRNLLMNQVGNRQLPKWAAEFDIASWPQFFLKYVVSHPAVTCAIPGSSKVEHVKDNQAAGHGRLPDAAARRRMEQFWEERI